MVRVGFLVVLAASSVAGQEFVATLTSAINSLGLDPLSRPGPMVGGLADALSFFGGSFSGIPNSHLIRTAVLSNKVSLRQMAMVAA